MILSEAAHEPPSALNESECLVEVSPTAAVGRSIPALNSHTPVSPERLSGEYSVLWHARRREGWLAPAPIVRRQNDSGGKPLFPTTALLLLSQETFENANLAA